MTPKWLFVPDDSSSGTAANIQVDATLVATSGVNLFNLSSYTESGSDVDDWQEYPHRPFRKSTSYIELLLRVTTTGQFADKNAFVAATSNYTGELTIGGDTLEHTSITIAGFSTIVRPRFNASSSDITSFWNGVNAGESLTFKLSYQGT